MTLDVDLSHRLGRFDLDIRFRSEDRLTALFGPSGSGKTTIVKAIGGLLHPDRGRIAIGGQVLLDTQDRLFVPVYKRRIGMVFQEGRLFPHLSVRRNLLFGRGFVPKIERKARFDDVVDLLGIGHLLARRPMSLSGGEKQRVAIGRALLADPRLLLMDEPLASLDEARKAEIYPYIERLRDEAGVPIVLVSHSVPEVSRLATSVVILEAGRVKASGPTSEILRHPSLFPGSGPAEAGALLDTQVLFHDEAFGLSVLRAKAGTLTVPRLKSPVGTPVRVRLRARDVMLSLQAPEGLSALNVLPGTIAAIEQSDAATLDVTLDCGGDAVVAHVTRKSAVRLGLEIGQSVHAVIKTVAFDAETFGSAPTGPLAGGAWTFDL